MSHEQTLDEIAKAMDAHGAWKLKLRAAIMTGNSDVSPDTARSDDHCAFGQWLQSASASPEMRASPYFQSVRQLHAEFHRSAGDVLRHALDKNTDQANTLLSGSFSTSSHVLMVELTKWKRELTAARAA